MDQPKWLKLSALGLLIVILGITYFVVVGRFSSKKEVSKQQPSTISQGSVSTASPTPSASPITSPNAYQKLTDKQVVNNTSNLPNTGFAEDMFMFVTATLILSGMALRKYSR